MYKVTQLANGLVVASVEMPHMRSVSVGLWVSAGSRYEPEELNGVCHFIEHMLFKGTKTRSAREISEAVEGIGGYLNAFTSEETTCFYAKACHDRYEQLVQVLFDMLTNPRFEREDIDKEREVIREELSMYLDEPQHQVQEVLNAIMWPDQPLGRSITGTSEALNRLARPQLLGFLNTHYVAESALLVAAGRVSHRSLVRAVNKYAPRFRKGGRNSFPAALINQQGPRIKLVTKKTEQTQMALGIRTCSRHDSRRFAIRLLSTILGENMSSRLFQVIREDRGLAYSVYSTPSFFADTGDFVISAGLETGNLEKTLKLILTELTRLKNALPTIAELRRARDYVLGQIDLSLEGTENQMNWAGEQFLGYGAIHPPAPLKRRLAMVTREDIRAVAREFFRDDRLNLALVSPLKSARSLQGLLHLR